MARVWSLDHSHGVFRVGTKPAQLFESRDGGESFTRNTGLAGFPDRDEGARWAEVAGHLPMALCVEAAEGV